MYCSDVAGAFDRVKVERLIQKLRAMGINPRLVNFVASWLQARRARVLVGGKESEEMKLQDMVFQGTVLGPLLWLVFFADASRAIVEAAFNDIIFADDLNAYRVYDKKTRNSTMTRHAKNSQGNLHAWGAANQVTFDSRKESMSITSRHAPGGPNFKLLGIHFDTELTMEETVTKLHNAAMWKVTSILRARKYYDTEELVDMYKTKILSYLEYRTAAIYHAKCTLLEQIDKVQRRFLREVQVSEEDALIEYKLAPLCARRDIAMLGLIHRTVLGNGPKHFQRFFKRAQTTPHPQARTRVHSKQLETRRTGKYLEVLKYSALGLIDVYNSLPQKVVDYDDVTDFQSALQGILKTEAAASNAGRQSVFSPRHEVWDNRLATIRRNYEGPVVATDTAAQACSAKRVFAWLQFCT